MKILIVSQYYPPKLALIPSVLAERLADLAHSVKVMAQQDGNDCAEAGSALGARSRGLGTSATRLLMDYAFNDVGLHKLYSTILATNEASLAAYVGKLAWRVAGRLREHVWRDGQRVDLVQIGIVRSEFSCAVHEHGTRPIYSGIQASTSLTWEDGGRIWRNG